MGIGLSKTRRYLRRLPLAWWTSFTSPLWNAGQLLTWATAWIGLVLILQNATDSERDIQAFEWAVSIQAFAIALAGWAVISLVVGAFKVVASDNANGKWDRHHRFYNEPYLVATERFEAGDGETQLREIRFADAEPNSFVYYSCVLTPEVSRRMGVMVTGGKPNDRMILHPDWRQPPLHHNGTRLPRDCSATLCARMQVSTVPVIVRVYCHSFFLGRDGGSHA